MAGRRRSTGRPTQASARHKRSRQLMATRMGKARTPSQRLYAAFEYARAQLARMDPHAAQVLSDELARALIDATDHAARRKEPR